MKFPKFPFRKKSKSDKQEPSAESATGPGVSNTKGASGGKQWLILHVEKICLLAAIGIFGFLVYSVAGKLSLEPKQNPEELANKAEQMEARIEQSDWDGSEERIPDFAAQVEKANQSIKTDTYNFSALTGIEARQLRKRTRPQFLPAENIWVEGGSGIFWLTGGGVAKENEGDNPAKDAEGGGGSVKLPQNLEGEPAPEGATAAIKHWAVITALIPSKKQKAIYERHFQEAEAYQPLEDVPDYMLARIQRIEVTPDDPEGGKADWSHPDLQWEWTPQSAQSEISVSGTALGRLNPGKHDSWATEADELVDSRYVHPRLTTPLGPLGYSDWQPWATHPEIPLAVNKPPQNAEDPRRGNRPGNNNRNSDKRPARGRGNSDKKKKGSDRGDRFGDLFTPPAEETGPDSVTQPANKPEEKQPPQQLANQNQLLRLFDFDVEPGKTYLYRVQLLLKNPNHDQPSRILKNPRDRKPRFALDTWLPWSRQSVPVYIPPVMAVYAAGVSDPVKKEATVIVRKPTGPQGALQIGKLSVQQGGIIGGTLEDSLTMDGLSGKLVKGSQPLDTDLLLVDVRPRGLEAGGTGLSELLLLDASGQFLLQNTGLDQEQATLFNELSASYKQAKVRKEKTKESQKNQDGEQDATQKAKDLLGGKKSKKNNTKRPNRRE